MITSRQATCSIHVLMLAALAIGALGRSGTGVLPQIGARLAAGPVRAVRPLTAPHAGGGLAQSRLPTPGQRRHARESSLRRHIQILAYDSFRHAQGCQPLQLHFIQAYVRWLRADGVPFDPAAGADLDQHVQRLCLPHGHVDVPDQHQVHAQFRFWAALLWDTSGSVYTDDPNCLPDRYRLERLASEVGGTPAMTSFTAAEMTALAGAFAVYRDPASPTRWADVVEQHFVPALLRVELGFQGSGPHYPRRPRTDGGDPHESRLLGHCKRALRSYQNGTPDVIATIYQVVCRRLDQLAGNDNGADTASVTYRELIAAYNRNHPDETVTSLHVPVSAFTVTTRAGELA